MRRRKILETLFSFTYFHNTTWDWVGLSENYKICWVWWMLECGSAVKSWQCELSGLVGRKIHKASRLRRNKGSPRIWFPMGHSAGCPPSCCEAQNVKATSCSSGPGHGLVSASTAALLPLCLLCTCTKSKWWLQQCQLDATACGREERARGNGQLKESQFGWQLFHSFCAQACIWL